MAAIPDEDKLRVNISTEEFSLKGRVDLPPKFWYLLLAILAMTFGLTWDELEPLLGGYV